MLKRFFSPTLAGIVVCLATVANAQDAQQSPATQYERFLKRTDVVIVTQSYPLPNLPGGAYRVSAKVAWGLGETTKVYAVEIADRIIDFDQVGSIQDGLDKLIRAVNTSFDTLNAASMSYASPWGLSASYYSHVFDGSAKPKKVLSLVAGSYTYNSPNIESLTQFHDLITQARQKLVSLGAK